MFAIRTVRDMSDIISDGSSKNEANYVAQAMHGDNDGILFTQPAPVYTTYYMRLLKLYVISRDDSAVPVLRFLYTAVL